MLMMISMKGERKGLIAIVRSVLPNAALTCWKNETYQYLSISSYTLYSVGGEVVFLLHHYSRSSILLVTHHDQELEVVLFTIFQSHT